MAFQSHPNSASAHYAMGLYFIRTQFFNDALIHLQLSTRLLPNNPVYIYTYVLTLKSTGKISEAHSLIEHWMVTHKPDAQLLQLKNSF
jgi:cytochrome c-type biogenesis protein CcmH/NrfG